MIFILMEKQIIIQVSSIWRYEIFTMYVTLVKELENNTEKNFQWM